MIIISDIHAKNKEPYKKAVLNFLDYCIEKYSNEIIIQLGDLFDSSNPHNSLEKEIVERLLKFKEFHCISGNHDQSYKSGNTLEQLNLHKNIYIYDKETVVDIEGYSCLILPYQKDMIHYNNIQKHFDFIFGHFMIKQEAFGNEYVDISALNYKKMILGHIHLKRQYGDIIIPGCPITTRNLEQNNPILQIDKDFEITEIEVPEFLKIETINYGNGKKTLNKDFIYNIVDAPSVKSVYEKFKEYYIRHEGIQLKQDTVGSDVKFDFDSNNLMKYFKQFIDENKVNKEYSDIIAGYLVR